MKDLAHSQRHRIRRPFATGLVLAAAAALLALTVAGPIAAKAPERHRLKARAFECVAVVTGVDATAGTLTATVQRASRVLKPSIGKDVTFTVPAKAVILKRTGDGDRQRIALKDVAVGDRVRLLGRVLVKASDPPVFKAWIIVDWGPKPAS